MAVMGNVPYCIPITCVVVFHFDFYRVFANMT